MAPYDVLALEFASVAAAALVAAISLGRQTVSCMQQLRHAVAAAETSSNNYKGAFRQKPLVQYGPALERDSIYYCIAHV